MKKLRLLSVAAALGLLISGCDGPQGPIGPLGAQGPSGTNGSANINIQIVPVPNTDASVGGYWTANSPSSPTSWSYAFQDNYIVDQNNAGVVVTFSHLGGGGSASGPWFAMPIYNYFAGGDEVTYSWYTNTIVFQYIYTALPPAELYFNVAVIPVSIMKRHPNINWKNGAEAMTVPEVKAAFVNAGISDVVVVGRTNNTASQK